ncbi:hypothetical protein [Niabella ginsengisoli]|uniref:CN hydrolase domain-containing protein n=1 Tax=Niabella ginsengisoli TaxID=522298 RepID=A0ABS9SK04_9BACT|nr:hypothetical protein [Niabella ginsengisoli]MCH5598670.1 hypothetical protein [Niabella ginsengisoli]
MDSSSDFALVTINAWILATKKSISFARRHIYISRNFHGQAIIAFGVTTGVSTIINDGRRIFMFDTSGILLAQAQAPRGIVDQKFFMKVKMGY